MSDPAVSSFLIKLLCSHQGRLPLNALPEHLDLPPGHIDEILREEPHKFAVSGDVVLARGSIRICPRYLKGEGEEYCGSLHLCRRYLQGQCYRNRRNPCRFSHDVSSVHNRAVLKAHDVNCLNDDELKILLLQNDHSLLPEICWKYLQSTCDEKNGCRRLHVCGFYTRGECNRHSCKHSHNLLESSADLPLRNSRLSTTSIENFQMLCVIKCNEVRQALKKEARDVMGKGARGARRGRGRGNGRRQGSRPRRGSSSQRTTGSEGSPCHTPNFLDKDDEESDESASSESQVTPSVKPSNVQPVTPSNVNTSQIGPTPHANPPRPPVNIPTPKTYYNKITVISNDPAATVEKATNHLSSLGISSPATSPATFAPGLAGGSQLTNVATTTASTKIQPSPPAPASLQRPVSTLPSLVTGSAVSPSIAAAGNSPSINVASTQPKPTGRATVVTSSLTNSHTILSPTPSTPSAATLRNTNSAGQPKVETSSLDYEELRYWRLKNLSEKGQYDPPGTWTGSSGNSSRDNALRNPAPTYPTVPTLNVEPAKEVSEICLHHIWYHCKLGNKCGEMHYHLPYRWQCASGTDWRDFSGMEGIEKAFCDPYMDSKSGLDFQTMKCGGNNVRRLSTPSTISKPSQFVLTTEWLWYWEDEHGKWTEYGNTNTKQVKSSITSSDLESIYLADTNSVVPFQAGQQYYEIRFKDMVQRNIRYGTARRMRRRPRYQSSEDVQKLKGTTKQIQASSPLNNGIYPADWDMSAMPEVGFKLNVLPETSPEYQKILNLFTKTVKGQMVKISRIQNKSLWEVFQWQKEQMKKTNKGKAVEEKQLFHGTDSSYCQAICHQNFDWRICGSHGTVYGQGSYFARDASYSHNYSSPTAAGKRTMFVARVLVGDFVNGDSTFKRPPLRYGSSTLCYDSCVDNVSNPSIFVVFEKHQVYPEYLLEYQEKKEEKNCCIS
ncbi:hypothetical protein GDO86_005063 [Hymenochirus boettgeri]|uniref:Uncharacterized protein n=1 Tax=Hymenochirus boettgeri TaxID=247094 RepID=A0A8T2J0J0_9PIPI|nr:hypothetical protein GDO86_005063 [Hymenochirus boettgeri]